MLHTEILPYLPSLLLHFVRAGAFFMALGVFGRQGESKMFRLILSLSLAAILWWVDDDKLLKDVVADKDGLQVLQSGSWLSLAVMTSVDAVVGFAAGFAVGLITQAMAVAGEILSHDMGFAMSRVMDPITGRASPVMSQFFQSLVMLLILTTNLHHGFIRVLAKSYEYIPVGHGFNIEPVFHRLNGLVSYALASAMHYAFPIMGVLVLLTAVLVMLARAVPNINLMEFSFGLRIALAMFASIFFLAEGMPFLKLFAESVLNAGLELFQGAA